MRERIFQDEWIRSWRHFLPDSHIIKIPDSIRGADSRFSPAKPYDFFAVRDGDFFAMELKLMTKIGGLPFNSVTEGQLLNLEEAVEAGGTSWIVVNYRVNEISIKQRKNAGLEPGTTRLNRVYIFDVGLFRELDREVSDKSLPHKHIVALIATGLVQTVDCAGELWDLKTLFDKEAI